jgi:hypothetical protein
MRLGDCVHSGKCKRGPRIGVGKLPVLVGILMDRRGFARSVGENSGLSEPGNEPTNERAASIGRHCHEHAQTEHLEAGTPPSIDGDEGPRRADSEQRAERENERRNESSHAEIRERVGKQRKRARCDEGKERGDAVPGGTTLFFRKILGRAGALVGSNAQIVADTHGQAVSEEIRHADNQHGPRRQGTPGDPSDHSERRDDAVVSAVHHVADVVAGDLDRAGRFMVQ